MTTLKTMRNNKGQFKKGHIPTNKKSKVIVICRQCYKDFSVPPYRGISAIFCSPSCRGKFNMIGEKHNQWKGGKPKCIDCGKVLSNYNNIRWGGLRGEDYLARRRFRSMMQKDIFERDNYTCRLCGSKKDLQVDHIQSWKDYVELRFSMDNCRTLCAKCHYKITFGREMPETVKGWGHNLLRRVNL